jgi:hypothetical protein
VDTSSQCECGQPERVILMKLLIKLKIKIKIKQIEKRIHKAPSVYGIQCRDQDVVAVISAVLCCGRMSVL